jgi:hypothetical protein
MFFKDNLPVSTCFLILDTQKARVALAPKSTLSSISENTDSAIGSSFQSTNTSVDQTNNPGIVFILGTVITVDSIQ